MTVPKRSVFLGGLLERILSLLVGEVGRRAHFALGLDGFLCVRLRAFTALKRRPTAISGKPARPPSLDGLPLVPCGRTEAGRRLLLCLQVQLDALAGRLLLLERALERLAVAAF